MFEVLVYVLYFILLTREGVCLNSLLPRSLPLVRPATLQGGHLICRGRFGARKFPLLSLFPSGHLREWVYHTPPPQRQISRLQCLAQLLLPFDIVFRDLSGFKSSLWESCKDLVSVSIYGCKMVPVYEWDKALAFGSYCLPSTLQYPLTSHWPDCW